MLQALLAGNKSTSAHVYISRMSLMRIDENVDIRWWMKD